MKIPPLKKHQDERVALQLGQTLRRLRKCANLSQEQLAEQLDLHQAAVCRIEKGQQDLEPWHLMRIAEIFDVRVSEFLCDCPNYWRVAERFGRRPPLDKRYVELPYSRGREVLPIFDFMRDVRGQGYVKRTFEKFFLHPEYMRSPDQPVGVNCGLDLLRHNIEQGVLNKTTLRKLAQGAQVKSSQGFLHELYLTQASPSGLLKTYILNRHHYDSNFRYEMAESNGRGFEVRVTPAEHMKDVKYRDATLGDTLCRYGRETLTVLPKYIGAPYAEVDETQCHFHGAESCVYKIKVS